MIIVVYSNDCPRCKVLKKKLDEKQLLYTVFDDVDKMVEMGIESVPMLSINGIMLNFNDAVSWINSFNR